MKAIDWLLADENPSIKYRTLTRLLGQSHDQAVYDKIWESRQVKKLLSEQANGVWDETKHGMHSQMKYMTCCAELGLRRDSRLDAAVEVAVSFLDRPTEEGAAVYEGCCTPLLLRAIVMMGYGEAVSRQLELFSAGIQHDGGFICKRLLDKKPSRKSCYKASLAALLLYAECDASGIKLSGKDELLQYFIGRNVFFTSGKQQLISEGKPGWRNIDCFFPAEPMRIGLPQIAAALTQLGVGECNETAYAYQLLRDKADDNMCYTLEGTLTKYPISFGKPDKLNKFVTYYAHLTNIAKED